MERNARIAALTYGVVCYALFFATFLYLVAFVADLAVPKTIETGAATDVGRAFLVDTLLIVLFGLQHSVMARPRFKAFWTRFVPRAVERSTYVLASSLVLIALMVFWQPIPASVWHVESEIGRGLVRGLFFLGVGTVLYSTFLIDHFDLFGLRQVVLHFRKQGLHGQAFRDAEPLPVRAPPALHRLDPDLLGGAQHERGALPVLARHDGLHPAGDPDGGARPRRRPRRAVSRAGARARRPSCPASSARAAARAHPTCAWRRAARSEEPSMTPAVRARGPLAGGLLPEVVARAAACSGESVARAVLELTELERDRRGPRARLRERPAALGGGRAAAGTGFVAGVDPSELMVRHARARNRRWIALGRAEVRAGTAATSRPSRTGASTRSTAPTWSTSGRSRARDLAEIRRVLRPGGRLLLGFFPAEPGTAGATRFATGAGGAAPRGGGLRPGAVQRRTAGGSALAWVRATR